MRAPILRRFGQTAGWLLIFWAGATQVPAGEINRRILMLYDGSEGAADRSNVHRYLEMPINRCGLITEYHDVQNRPLPDPTRYRGITFWFQDERMTDAEDYCRWLIRAMQSGVRLLACNGTGAQSGPDGETTPQALIAEVERTFGLSESDRIGGTDNPFLLRLQTVQPKRFGFETRQAPPRLYYNYRRPLRNDVRSWRNLLRVDITGSESPLIAESRHGIYAVAAEALVRFFDQPVYHIEWDVDPFQLVEAAFQTQGLPRPDVTTAFGARAAFAHIDGDGMDNLSRDFPGTPRKASAIVLDEILSRYPVPITIGLVAARVDPKALGSEAALPLWRRIMAHPLVQVGCHGYAHPFNWAEGTIAFNLPHYTFSPTGETYDAMVLLEKHVLSAGRKVEVFLWTGDCAPTAASIAEVERYGALNINGGNPRYDALYNSISHICGLTRPVGRFRQAYAPAGNEYLYTEGWTENFGGFQHILETFKRSTSPRLLPVNVYYHFYLAERQAGLRSLHTIYRWCLKQRLCWLQADEYIRSVQDFHRLRLEQTTADRWHVRDYGACRTLRFDAEKRAVDLTLSRNVLGFSRHDGALYVTLGAGKEAEVTLTPELPSGLGLESSTSALRSVTTDNGSWQGEARLYAPGTLRLHTAKAMQTFTVHIGSGSATNLTSDAQRILTIPLAQGTGEWRRVRVGH